MPRSIDLSHPTSTMTRAVAAEWGRTLIARLARAMPDVDIEFVEGMHLRVPAVSFTAADPSTPVRIRHRLEAGPYVLGGVAAVDARDSVIHVAEPGYEPYGPHDPFYARMWRDRWRAAARTKDDFYLMPRLDSGTATTRDTSRHMVHSAGFTLPDGRSVDHYLAQQERLQAAMPGMTVRIEPWIVTDQDGVTSTHDQAVKVTWVRPLRLSTRFGRPRLF